MSILLNYLGQLRLYSLADLIILLLAIQATSKEFAGVILLHVGFLAFLESRHSHSYRRKVPNLVWIALGIAGIFLYGHIEVIGFIVFSYLYAKKNKGMAGGFSFLSRGLQLFFLVAGITSFASMLPWVALGAFSVRNLLGDFRDVEKDTKEGMMTMPIVMGMKKGFRYAHLFATMLTTILWWSLGDLHISYLVGALIIEIVTYQWTPRR
ncbi:MAG: hypothetical protein V4526_02630 [Patescibacteria group bacterium]